ncbi:uncharacterized protein BDR25DRAFT_342886 [Lindgomyces ingoldianus]|uniref:Uncharacterized protein n=1 Tax=Lindgomyces ingoldianus TaxID=673940 RepID=A0ACB6QVF3_9PLEO|nr:uncharacterized protein BDR25DRAFT_342886 [Lindgomyces ingoldianus]KAF2470558.1 hypothetical protein BDR25DRAFT_342886 [Lindgomyces ingoldianus]
MVGVLCLLALLQFASFATATRFAGLLAQETPLVPGYFANEAPIPQPTSPPQAVRQLVPRDRATCGYMMANGAANVCGDSQYCTTSAAGDFGVWNCCNPGSCFLQETCSYSVECKGDSPYCVTSYMSQDGTTFSRFMCGTTSSIVFMVYSSSDLPQYTSSVLAASRSSVLASASAAAESSKAAAEASSLSANLASQSGMSTIQVTHVVTASDGQVSTEVFISTAALGQQTGSPTSSSAAKPTSSGGDGGLSTGGIAGAVVGSVVGIAIIGALAFIAYRIKKKQSEDKDEVPQMTGVPVEHYKQYPTSQVGSISTQQWPGAQQAQWQGSQAPTQYTGSQNGHSTNGHWQ